METIKLLKAMRKDKIISYQAYKTYMGQVSSGDELACIKGMLNKKLITKEKADFLANDYMMGYSE